MFKPRSATTVLPQSALAEEKKIQPTCLFFAYLIVFNALRGDLVCFWMKILFNLIPKLFDWSLTVILSQV